MPSHTSQPHQPATKWQASAATLGGQAPWGHRSGALAAVPLPTRCAAATRRLPPPTPFREHHLLAGGPLAKLLALRDERGSSLEQLVVHVHLVAHARPSVAAIPPSPLPCHPCHLLLRRCSPMLSPQKRAVATEAVAAELLPLLLYLPLLCRPLHLLLLPVL